MEHAWDRLPGRVQTMFNQKLETMRKVEFLRSKEGYIVAYFPKENAMYLSTWITTGDQGKLIHVQDLNREAYKPATRLEFAPILDELKRSGYQDLKIILPTKKAFKELLRVDPYTSIGFGSRITTWVCFWDWDQGVYGERSGGYKFGCAAAGVRKSDLVNQFYDYLFVNGIRPEYSKLKVAETEKERFKIPISLNW